MKIAGIIAEYNPFHNGHKFHIESTKSLGASHVICLLGGNFTQRGEASVIPKIARAKCALENGADLVIELPHVFSIAPAGDYAEGAVNILSALGCVDYISFGSESGNKESFNRLSELAENFDTQISEYMSSTGCGYPSAREQILRSNGFSEEADMLSSPNNILGLEYVSAIKKAHAPMDFLTVKRSVSHNTDKTNGNICSASHLRDLLFSDFEKAKDFLPENVYDILCKQAENGRCPIKLSRLDREIISRLRWLKLSDFEKLPWISEGLHNRIFDAVQRGRTVEEIVSMCVSKRYTASRIRRILIAAATGITKNDVEGFKNPPYIRILGLNEKGREILRSADKTCCKVPIINRSSDLLELKGDAKRLFEIEKTAGDLYSMAFEPMGECSLELTENIYSL